MLKVNETPVRTSRSFNINNIKLDVNIPKKQEFNNVEVISSNTVLENDLKIKKLLYGNGNILEENISKNANHILKIVEDKKGETIEVIYTFDDNNLSLVNNIEVYAKNEINVIIKYVSNSEKECFHNGIIRVYRKRKFKSKYNNS